MGINRDWIKVSDWFGVALRGEETWTVGWLVHLRRDGVPPQGRTILSGA